MKVINIAIMISQAGGCGDVEGNEAERQQEEVTVPAFISLHEGKINEPVVLIHLRDRQQH